MYINSYIFEANQSKIIKAKKHPTLPLLAIVHSDEIEILNPTFCSQIKLKTAFIDCAWVP
jgi:hypothetical protein